MCPPRIIRHNNLVRELLYQAWLDTALCCISFFYRHNINNVIICDEYYGDKAPYDRSFYHGVSRYYIPIDITERFEQYQIYEVIIP